MLFLMGEWLNSGGGGRFTVLHGGARIFFLWGFNPRKVSDVFLVFFLCLVFSEISIFYKDFDEFSFPNRIFQDRKLMPFNCTI
jgi:hypothetical protein